MHIHFPGLNLVFPVNPCLLLNIDKLIGVLSGYKTLSTINAYSKYNQINMDPLISTKTAFIANNCIYYYQVMPFKLKNVCPTY